MQQIKNILVSQPYPCDYTKSPYKSLADKFNLNITFKKVIKIVGIPADEFRQHGINLLEHTAVIFNSRHAADNFFRIVRELNIEIPMELKYFCISDTIAYYIQKYVNFKKRKFFFGDQTTEKLMELLSKHKEEKFLLPVSEESLSDLLAALERSNINFTKAPMYRTIPDNIADEIDIEKFDMIALFSPVGVQSLKLNYPKYKQENRLIAAFGKTVWCAVRENGFELSLPVPTPTASSMTQAIEQFIIDYKQFDGDVKAIEKKRKLQEEKLYRKEEEVLKNSRPKVGKNDEVSKQVRDRVAALRIIELKKEKKRACPR
jgi:uroporphyrinogen-III synthase